ncbi:MAG: hypothetical protein CMB99_00265 [Flavobacteriaceae bacterium]|nr:hypothetical protein [Flavobacteriaceae bacterium]
MADGQLGWAKLGDGDGAARRQQRHGVTLLLIRSSVAEAVLRKLRATVGKHEGDFSTVATSVETFDNLPCLRPTTIHGSRRLGEAGLGFLTSDFFNHFVAATTTLGGVVVAGEGTDITRVHLDHHGPTTTAIGAEVVVRAEVEATRTGPIRVFVHLITRDFHHAADRVVERAAVVVLVVVSDHLPRDEATVRGDRQIALFEPLVEALHGAEAGVQHHVLHEVDQRCRLTVLATLDKLNDATSEARLHFTVAVEQLAVLNTNVRAFRHAVDRLRHRDKVLKLAVAARVRIGVLDSLEVRVIVGNRMNVSSDHNGGPAGVHDQRDVLARSTRLHVGFEFIVVIEPSVPTPVPVDTDLRTTIGGVFNRPDAAFGHVGSEVTVHRDAVAYIVLAHSHFLFS